MKNESLLDPYNTVECEQMEPLPEEAILLPECRKYSLADVLEYDENAAKHSS